MKTCFEETISPNILMYPPEKQDFVTHNERKYLKIGKSYTYGTLSTKDLLVKSMEYLGHRILSLFSSSQDLQKKHKDLFKEISKNRIKTVHHVLRMDRRMITPTIIDAIQNLIGAVDIKSSTIFLKVSNGSENIPKQYIIKNLDNTSLTKDFFKNQIELITQSLEFEIGEYLTSCNYYVWVILLRGSDNNVYCLDKRAQGTIEFHGIWDKNKGALQTTQSRLEKMNFPSFSTYIKGEEFIPGKFYQPI